MIDKNEIPKSWEIIKVSEAGELLRGVNYKKENSSSQSQENYLPVLRANNIQNGELNFEDLVFVSKKYVAAKQLVKKGDIVFAMSSGSKHLVGKSAKAKENFNGSFGAFCAVFRPNEYFNKDFVACFFQSPYYKKLISAIAKGTNINNLKREHILDLDFPVPPSKEQERIFSKLEELFSDLDKGIESLEKAQKQLKVYRQAVLKWAFEGRLTNEKIVDGELPIGWIKSNLGMLKEFSLYGPRFSSQDYSETGVAILRTTDISENGKVDWVNAPKLNLTEPEYQKYKLIKDDLLITRTGSIGTASIFNDDKRAIAGAFLIYYRLKKPFNIQFIFHFIKSHTAQKHFKKFSSGVGRPNLNVPNIELLEIPIPPLDKQNEIVKEIESRLSVCDKIEETIENSLLQAEALRLSIIKKAFEGKLVKQNPKDEPATKLLERMRAEKKKNEMEKKTKLKLEKVYDGNF
ncbi:MAG: restriction endonuclease subunit S [Chitinophagales bacterium]|nr:restriction endonuclease subunit S [Bacteroidota bacterium]MBK8488343.1 restriction endonuclease subunit S [Bacteroidota bacterium]MBK8681892.1 restriction endonuclease subunit S [Bacteroidota bacterium]